MYYEVTQSNKTKGRHLHLWIILLMAVCTNVGIFNYLQWESLWIFLFDAWKDFTFFNTICWPCNHKIALNEPLISENIPKPKLVFKMRIIGQTKIFITSSLFDSKNNQQMLSWYYIFNICRLVVVYNIEFLFLVLYVHIITKKTIYVQTCKIYNFCTN